jgi:hypothetical protein
MINMIKKFICCNNYGCASTSINLALRHGPGNYYINNDLLEISKSGESKISLRRLTVEDPVKYRNWYTKMGTYDSIFDLGDFFSFGFVRNPKHRYVALYLKEIMTRAEIEQISPKKALEIPQDYFKIDVEDENNEFGLEKGTYNFNFDFYLRKIVPGLAIKQNYQFCDLQNNVLASFIGRIENIDEDWISVCNTIGLNSKHLGHAGYLDIDNNIVDRFYSDDLKDFLFQEFSDEFEVFGYEKG